MIREDAREQQGDAPDRSRSWDRVLAGALLVITGLLWLLDAAADVAVPWRSLLPIALIVVGLATVALALRSPAGELIGIGVVITILVVVSALAPARLGFTVGERTEQPTSLTQAAAGFGHGIGSLEVDLRDLDTTEAITVEAGVGVGDLRVVVPAGVALDVRATAAVGDVEVFDRNSSGIGPKLEERVEDDDGPILRIDASVGVGRVQVVRS